MKMLVVGLVLAAALTLVAASCEPLRCDAKSCVGCCDASGVCQAGSMPTACGVQGSSCQACLPGAACLNGQCSLAASGGGTGGGTGGGSGGTSKRVFVTASAYDGNLGGLAGADTKCTTAALGAGLGGSWKAWLSDTNTDALNRIADVGPWYFVDRTTRVFNNKANLATIPLTPIIMTEQGNRLPTALTDEVWTGTFEGGLRSTANCFDWSSNTNGTGHYGTAQYTNNWSNYASQAVKCSATLRMYCLEQ